MYFLRFISQENKDWTMGSSLLGTPTPVKMSSRKQSMTPWTPSFWSRYGSDISDDEEDMNASLVSTYNKAMQDLSEAANVDKPSPLKYQVFDWDAATEAEKKECTERASDACRLITSIIAPNDQETLLHSMTSATAAKPPATEPQLSADLEALITAFAKAPTRNLKTQILSIYAHAYPKATLQKLHEPYGGITQWQIRRARAHARMTGPGMPTEKTFSHRVKLDMVKVDHFIEFTNRPYFHQDVAYGVRQLKLENGTVITMPDVIRTVTRSTLISQFVL